MVDTPYYLQKELTREQLLGNENFLDDASQFLYDRTGIAYAKPEEIVDELAEIMRWGTSNEVSMAKTYTYAKNASAEQRDTLGKMFLAYDKTKGMTGGLEFAKDYAGAIITAPSTLATLGTGFVGLLGKGAIKGGMTRVAGLIHDLTVKGLIQKTTKGQALKQGAVRGAAVEGPIAAFTAAGEAETRKETGRKEFENIHTGEQAVYGGLFGAAFGGVAGGGARLLKRKQELRAAQEFGEGLAATGKRVKEARKGYDLYFKTLDQEGGEALIKIRAGVKVKLDPLKDSIAGRELKEQLVPTPDGFKPTLSDDRHENIMDAASEILHKYGVDAIDVTADKRISERIIDAINFANRGADDGSPAFQAIDDILEKYALTREQFTAIFRADMSEWGKTGQRVGQFAKDHFKRLSAAADNVTASRFLSPEAQKRFDEVTRLAQSGEVKIWKGIQKIDKFRLGMMTIQTATTIRNTVNATARTALYALDNFFYGAATLNPSRMQSGVTATRQMLNPSESNYLRLMLADNMPDEFQTLFRQMADIEAGSISNSNLVGIARFLNRANTLADNAFKRAIFMSELQARIGRTTLKKHMKEGTFGKIDREDIAKAMEEALHFTYQKSFPKGKNRFEKGFWNSIANDFIGAFSNPATSTIIPFPRFVANSLEFMYKHAPLIGIADPALFRRWALRKGQKGEIRKRIAQQLTGTAMLYGAIQLRAQQGPTANWWEIYDEDTGKYKNALAFYGPFAPWMLLADKIVRTEWGNTRPFMLGKDTRAKWDTVEKQSLPEGILTKETGREFLRAAFGTTFRTGTTGEFGRQLGEYLEDTDIFKAKGDISKKVIGEKYKDADSQLDTLTAKWVGNYLNTFVVPFGEVRDVVAAYDPKGYAGVKETDVINPVELAIRKFLRSAPINSEGEYFGLATSKDIAEVGVFKMLGGKGTAAEDVVTATAIPGTKRLREEGITRQLTGIGSPTTKNVLERELQKHQLLSYKLFPKIKNDPELTRRLRLEYQQLVSRNIIPYIQGEHIEKYAKLSPEDQKLSLKEQIQYVRDSSLNMVERSIVRELKQNKFTSAEKKEQVNDQLTRVMQTRFKQAKELIQLRIIKDFNKTFDRPPNMDSQKDLESLLKAVSTTKIR